MDYLNNFKKKKMPDFEGMTYSESFYKPMLELVYYLKYNDFSVYIVSRSERGLLLAMIDGVIDLPNNTYVVGKDYGLKATNQADQNDLSYNL